MGEFIICWLNKENKLVLVCYLCLLFIYYVCCCKLNKEDIISDKHTALSREDCDKCFIVMRSKKWNTKTVTDEILAANVSGDQSKPNQNQEKVCDIILNCMSSEIFYIYTCG